VIALALALALVSPAPPAEPVATAAPRAPWTLDEVLAALREVESGGTADGGRSARGDRGSALGPYQIHQPYWQDARVPGRYEDCADAAYSRRVVLAYWSRWCPRALANVDAEVLARVHNGGPQGHTKLGTRPYWARVERALIEARERREQLASVALLNAARPASSAARAGSRG
jgi:hypothetical protein